MSTRVPLVDVILLNATLGLFFLYTYESNIRSATASYARWGLLLIWTGSLVVRFANTPDRPDLRLPLSGKICGVMLVWFAITALLSVSDPTASLAKLGSLVLLYVLGYVLLRRVHASTNFLSVFIYSLLVQIPLFLLHGFWAGINISEFASARERGLFVRQGVPAQMAGTVIIFCIALLSSGKRRSVLARVGMFAAIVVSLATIFATGSRMPAVAAAAAAFVWYAARKRARLLPFLLVGAVGVFFLGRDLVDWYQNQQVYARTGSTFLSGREAKYRTQIEEIFESPLTGTGFAAGASISAVSVNKPRSPYARSGTRRAMDHSAYLGVFAETGIIGGLLFLAWIFNCVSESLRYAKKRADDWQPQFGFMFVVMLVVNSVAESTLMMAGGALIVAFYVIMGQTFVGAGSRLIPLRSTNVPSR